MCFRAQAQIVPGSQRLLCFHDSLCYHDGRRPLVRWRPTSVHDGSGKHSEPRWVVWARLVANSTQNGNPRVTSTSESMAANTATYRQSEINIVCLHCSYWSTTFCITISKDKYSSFTLFFILLATCPMRSLVLHFMLINICINLTLVYLIMERINWWHNNLRNWSFVNKCISRGPKTYNENIIINHT